jgi:D-sedoheptulose 7-phosphate isomerase
MHPDRKSSDHQSSDHQNGADTFVHSYLAETVAVIAALDPGQIERCAHGLAQVRARKGRLFILGVGGSAGHASHAVNDFRKLCEIEAYAPTDNVSELTARTNDEGWDTTFAAWLRTSHLGPEDAVLVFSVGGGNEERQVSVNLVRALQQAQMSGASIYGIVGRDGGYTATVAHACVVIPPLFPDHVTPHTEGLCAVVWHLLVSHPALARTGTKWESVVAADPEPVGGRVR